MRRILLLPVLVVALVGFTKSQGASDNKPSPAVEVGSKEALIKEAQAFADQIEDAKQRRDKAALESFYADDFICKDERFGVGEVLHKAQFLARRSSPTHGPEDQVVTEPSGKIKLTHSKVSWLVFGNTVIRTGYSRTILRHRGRLSKGPRLFTFIYIKRDGRWQIAAEDVFDIPKGYEEPES
jgi:ketosteroid isomerase-like protein